MRRSITVKLTLLPMLASAAVVAQPAMPDPAPPAAEPMLSPPGLTPTIDEGQQDRCPPAAAGCAPPVSGRQWILRGGFGQYFWPSGS